jgi:hypothetical protein
MQNPLHCGSGVVIRICPLCPCDAVQNQVGKGRAGQQSSKMQGKVAEIEEGAEATECSGTQCHAHGRLPAEDRHCLANTPGARNSELATGASQFWKTEGWFAAV